MASTWSGTANNETISYNALSNAISNYNVYGFPPRCPSWLHTGNQQATKEIVLDCLTCNPYAPVVASATTNQLVVKSEVIPFANAQSFVYDIADGGPYVNCNDAAALFYRGPYAPLFNTLYYDGTFQVGTTGRTAGNVASVDTTKYYNLLNGVGATSGKGVKFSLVEALYQVFQVAEICDYVAPTPTPTVTQTQTNTPSSTPPSTPASTPGGTPSSTNTATPSTTPPPASCECYQTTNTTDEAVDITYTPCGDAETTVSVPGSGVLNFCVEPLTIIYPGIGLTYPALCNISCEYDGVDCSTCGGTPTATPTNTATPTPTPISYGCNEYRIENNTESSIGVSWYDCSGVQQFNNNLGSGQQTTFCANQSYGLIDYSSGELFDLGPCPVTPTPTPTPTETPYGY